MVELYAMSAMHGWLITCGVICLILIWIWKKITD